jgi:D-aminoacyl-tRNA deacylase
MKLIVNSTQDTASMNIAQKIIELYEFQKTPQTYQELPIYQKLIEDTEMTLVTIKTESIQAQYITDDFNAELIIFVSKHSSQSGIPTLSVHTPGNLTTQAQKGGTPKQISIAPANAMKEVLKEMQRQVEEKHLEYKVSYECTHHGPSLNVPTMFAELGSSPTQWKDAQAAEAVAHAAITAAKTQAKSPAAIGIGGPHYNEKFTKIALTTDTAFGHMIPKYMVAGINLETLMQCRQKTLEKVEKIILDWKGIRGEDKPTLTKTIARTGLNTEKV